jgi:hypothetical protein
MNENNEEKNGITNSSTTDNAFENLAGNLLKNEKSLGSIMQLATTLLKNDSLLHSITERAAANQSSKNPVTKDEKHENTIPTVIQNQENATKDISLELSILSQKLEHIINDISDLKIGLQDLKEQNSKLFKKSKK